jgi:hypothetical protein
LDVLFRSQAGAARKTVPGACHLQRPSAEIVRLLGGGDPPILVVDVEQTERFLRHSLVPLVLRVERGQEAKTLGSPLALAAPAMGLPMNVSFEGGADLVTPYAGRNLVDEALS